MIEICLDPPSTKDSAMVKADDYEQSPDEKEKEPPDDRYDGIDHGIETVSHPLLKPS